MQKDIVIVSAVRTPIGSFLGSLSSKLKLLISKYLANILEVTMPKNNNNG